MNSLLQEVTRSGTAAKAQATLKRPDLYGKTGTTNDSMDAWFAGYQPTLAAVTWDRLRHAAQPGQPRNRRRPEPADVDQLHGDRPQGRAVMEPTPPEGVVNVGGEWYLRGIRARRGVSNLGGAGLSHPNSSDRRRQRGRGAGRAQPHSRPVQELNRARPGAVSTAR
jgi:penicillin-binding protein 1A